MSNKIDLIFFKIIFEVSDSVLLYKKLMLLYKISEICKNPIITTNAKKTLRYFLYLSEKKINRTMIKEEKTNNATVTEEYSASGITSATAANADETDTSNKKIAERNLAHCHGGKPSFFSIIIQRYKKYSYITQMPLMHNKTFAKGIIIIIASATISFAQPATPLQYGGKAFALDTPDSSFSYLKFDSQNGKDVFEQVKRKYKTDSSLYYSYIKDLEFESIKDLSGLYYSYIKDLEFDFIEDLKGLYQYGILGEKTGIQMYFSSVIKSSKANEYIVDGKSKAGKNIVSFSGTITILRQKPNILF
jgi:hypothetical protein